MSKDKKRNKIRKRLRNWIKRIFDLYDIEDLTIGGHCGCCGAWIADEIFPKDWPYGVCEKCLLKVANVNEKKKWELAETTQNLRSEVYYHTNIKCDGKVVAQSSGIGRAEAEANAKMIITKHENQD